MKGGNIRCTKSRIAQELKAAELADRSSQIQDRGIGTTWQRTGLGQKSVITDVRMVMRSHEERIQRNKRDLGLTPGTGQHAMPGRGDKQVHMKESKSRASWKPRNEKVSNRTSGHEGLMPLRDHKR